MDATEAPLKFTRDVEVGRDVPIFDGLVIQAVIIDSRTVRLVGAVGGDVGRRLRVERAKRKKKLQRPGKPRVREDD